VPSVSCDENVSLFYGWKRLFYGWKRLSYGWKCLFYGWDGLFYGWETLIYGWKNAAQGEPEACPGVEAGPERGQSVGTWVGACKDPNQQGTLVAPTCRSYGWKGPCYGWKVHVINEKCPFYGWKQPFMDENVTFMDKNHFFGVMDEKVTLWMKLPNLWEKKYQPFISITFWRFHP
jgi:hypothetical protein